MHRQLIKFRFFSKKSTSERKVFEAIGRMVAEGHWIRATTAKDTMWMGSLISDMIS